MRLTPHSYPNFDKFFFDKVLIMLTSLPPLEILTKIMNKLGLSCAKLKPASLLSLLLLENLDFNKFEKWSTASEVNKVLQFKEVVWVK